MNIPEKSALILVDVQIGSTTKALYQKGSTQEDDYHKRLIQITDFFREQGAAIIHVIEVHRPDLSDFGRELDGSENVHCLENVTEFYPPTGPVGNECKIPKRRYSAFLGTDLELYLNCLGITDLFIVGGMTDICVNYTSVDAIQYGYQVHVIKEGCNTHTPAKISEAVFRQLEYMQPGCVMTMDEILR